VRRDASARVDPRGRRRASCLDRAGRAL